MKGILICGGKGTRLLPLTKNTHKSLLPVGGKPMVLYPLQVLLDAGIHEIMLITGPEFAGNFMQFLGSGAKFGCSFTYRIQDEPKGIAQALGMAESFADGKPVCALLGDNIFEDNLAEHIHAFREKGGSPSEARSAKGGHLFLKEVPDPERFGVATLRDAPLRGAPQGNSAVVTSLEEKPLNPKTNLAVTGCYLYDARCFEIIHSLKPSARGELEITDVSRAYLEADELTATVLRGAWIDAGTHESLQRAENLVQKMFTR